MRRSLAAWLVWLGATCAQGAIVVTDTGGSQVTLPVVARRIVSLAPHATELLFAAGAGGQIVGVLSPADWPPEARALPRVGDANAVNLEGMLALKPDLVVTWPYLAPVQLERLRATGIAVYLSDPRAPETIAEDIERLGQLTGHAAQAARTATELRSRLDGLRRRFAGASNVRVFYEIWNRPMYTVGGGHLITAAIAICGGSNVFAAQTIPAPEVSAEAVLAAAPDAIVAGADGGIRPAWLDEWRAWPSLPAVAQGNLFVVDANLLHRAGPRFVAGVEQLCAALATARSRLPKR